MPNLGIQPESRLTSLENVFVLPILNVTSYLSNQSRVDKQNTYITPFKISTFEYNTLIK